MTAASDQVRRSTAARRDSGGLLLSARWRWGGLLLAAGVLLTVLSGSLLFGSRALP